MQTPVISRPLEPALFARAASLERHRVAPGGLTVIGLEPGDRLEVIDLEGDQRAELLAFAGSRPALGALGLRPSPDTGFISHLLHDGSREAAYMTEGLVRRG
ncbi:aminomethyltransferase, partial [Pseudomonas sp. 20P_3.2_Bac4]|nr:aminomethyltransferase [Pseudomonas sp. 20P_3.2_Bac4]